MSQFNDNLLPSLLKSAIFKLENNDKKGAITDLTKIIELNPNIEEVYYFRGNEYSDLMMFKEAIKDFEKALSLNPQSEKAIVNLAACKRQSGDMKGAYKDYSRAIKMFPNCSFAYFNRGHIKRYLNDLKGAKQDFEIAVKLGDFGSQHWVNLCSSFTNTATADELINSVPLNADELIDEGLKLERQGDWQMALGYLNRAVELYPDINEPISVKTQFEKRNSL